MGDIVGSVFGNDDSLNTEGNNTNNSNSNMNMTSINMSEDECHPSYMGLLQPSSYEKPSTSLSHPQSPFDKPQLLSAEATLLRELQELDNVDLRLSTDTRTNGHGHEHEHEHEHEQQVLVLSGQQHEQRQQDDSHSDSDSDSEGEKIRMASEQTDSHSSAGGDLDGDTDSNSSSRNRNSTSSSRQSISVPVCVTTPRIDTAPQSLHFTVNTSEGGNDNNSSSSSSSSIGDKDVPAAAASGTASASVSLPAVSPPRPMLCIPTPHLMSSAASNKTSNNANAIDLEIIADWAEDFLPESGDSKSTTITGSTGLTHRLNKVKMEGGEKDVAVESCDSSKVMV